MGKPPSPQPEGRIALSNQLIMRQRDAFAASTGGLPPRAIAVFACCARGSSMYRGQYYDIIAIVYYAILHCTILYYTIIYYTIH